MVHREIIQGPKEFNGNLREVHKNLREIILVRLKVIWHILGSQRGHFGAKGSDLKLHDCYLGHLESLGAPGKSLGKFGISLKASER